MCAPQVTIARNYRRIILATQQPFWAITVAKINILTTNIL